MTIKKNSLLIFFATIDILILDIVFKRLAVFYEGQKVELLGQFLNLDFYHTNPGIAFGLSVPRSLQIILTFLILGAFIYYREDWIFKNKKHPFLKSFLFGMILGGALGNLIDRVIQGYVIDFINLGPIPTFNIADVGIVVGIIGLILVNLFENNHSVNPTNPKISHKSQ